MPGANFCSGEIGHIKVEYENPKLCTCGQYGCAEAHASGAAIDKMVLTLANHNKNYALLFKKKGFPIDALGCEKLARTGEPLSLSIYKEAGKYLGRALASAINTLNPEIIFIGGGISASLDLLINPIKKELENAVVPFSRKTKIQQSLLGYNASILGAMVIVLLKLDLLEDKWLQYP